MSFSQRIGPLAPLFTLGALLALAAGPARAASSLALFVPAVPSCGAGVGYVALAPAPSLPPGGAVVRLRADGGLLTLPSAVPIPRGETMASFPVSAGAVRADTLVRVTATASGRRATVAAVVYAVSRPAYAVEDLGTLGGRTSAAMAISPAGRVAGEAETAGGRMHAFRTRADGSLEEIDPRSPDAGCAESVNDAGEVAGWVEDAAGRRTAFVADASGSVTRLTLPGAVSSRAMAINASGEAAGYFVTASGEGRAFRRDPDGYADDLGIFVDGSESFALGLTESGIVAGYADDHGRAYAFRTPPGGTLHEAQKVGEGTYAFAVNEAGVLAGAMYRPGEGYFHAFRGQTDGAVQDLGTLGFHDAAAYAINGRGVVVGGTYLLGGPEHHAFLYTDADGLRDLNALIPPGSGWVLVAATGINDRGEIVGYGQHEGVRRAFRLTPRVPPAAYGDVDGRGTVSAADAALLLRMAGGLLPVANLEVADIAPAPDCTARGFGDGQVGVADALRALRRAAGLEPVWP